MNTNNTEKMPSMSLNETISDALLKLKKNSTEKEGVNLVDITKKLSSKKFDKSGR